MKFSSGLLIGAAIGGYLIYNMSPDQRDRVASKAGVAVDKAGAAVDKVKSSSAAESVASNIGDVAGAASDRVADVVDSAGSTVSEAVGPNDTPTVTKLE